MLRKISFLALPIVLSAVSVASVGLIETNFAIAARNHYNLTSQQHHSPLPQEDYTAYLARLQEKIKANWRPPRSSQSYIVNSAFKVNSHGYISNISLIGGSPQQKRAAMSALEHSAPFDPLPASRVNPVEVHFKFEYNVTDESQAFNTKSLKNQSYGSQTNQHIALEQTTHPIYNGPYGRSELRAHYSRLSPYKITGSLISKEGTQLPPLHHLYGCRYHLSLHEKLKNDPTINWYFDPFAKTTKSLFARYCNQALSDINKKIENPSFYFGNPAALGEAYYLVGMMAYHLNEEKYEAAPYFIKANNNGFGYIKGTFNREAVLEAANAYSKHLEEERLKQKQTEAIFQNLGNWYLAQAEEKRRWCRANPIECEEERARYRKLDQEQTKMWKEQSDQGMSDLLNLLEWK